MSRTKARPMTGWPRNQAPMLAAVLLRRSERRCKGSEIFSRPIVRHHVRCPCEQADDCHSVIGQDECGPEILCVAHRCGHQPRVSTAHTLISYETNRSGDQFRSAGASLLNSSFTYRRALLGA